MVDERRLYFDKGARRPCVSAVIVYHITQTILS